MAEKKLTDLQLLAKIYHEKIAGVPMPWGTVAGNRFLGQAKTELKALKEAGGELADLILLLADLKNGDHAFTNHRPWAEWAKSNPYHSVNNPDYPPLYICHTAKIGTMTLIQDYCQVPECPPCHDTSAWAEWTERFGTKALRELKWNGVFPYAPWCDPEQSAMPPSKLKDIIGEVLVQKSLNGKREVEDKLTAMRCSGHK